MKHFHLVIAVIISLLFIGITPAFAQSTNNYPAIREKEHVYGNPGATITFAVFNDTECLFCKELHFILKNLQKAFSKDLKIVFKHFPLTSIHEFAYKEARALECVDVLGGNTAFWAYLDRLYTSPNPKDPNYLPRPERAQYNRPRHMRWLMRHSRNVGVLRTKLSRCVSKKHTKAAVDRDINEGMRIGVGGTPTTFIFSGNNFEMRIDGAQPEAIFTEIVRRLISTD